ncbi:FAD-dependent monooxygenase [Nocardiopsis aegyptia]|uniref:FAD-dependent monooxygenase n=1 Tax=Nocardiopsis aegyptia TaxID=220378 RepID=UPI00366F0C4B
MTVPSSGRPSALPDRAEVAIAGGGPSGCYLGLELAWRGVPSVIVEERDECDDTRPRAKTTNARTMTLLRRLGLADALRRRAPLSVEYSQEVAFCTGLAGWDLRRFHGAFQLRTGRYEPQPECGQQVAQPLVEEMLRTAAVEHPLITYVPGVRAVGARPAADGRSGGGGGRDGASARLEVQDGSGATTSIDARFVVGADGGSSAVRKSLGIALRGASAGRPNYNVLFRSRDLGDAVTLAPAVQYWVVNERVSGMVGRLDLEDTWWSILQGQDDPGDHTAAAELVRALTGVDAEIDVIATDAWTARMLLADSYGVRGVHLVGDAAHLNPPWGGHGFNTCVGDAANLAWKVAAVHHGWADESLLDSYEAERRPVARRMIEDAAANGRALAHDFVSPALDEDSPAGRAARESAGRALAVKTSEFHSEGLVFGYEYCASPWVTPDGTPPPARDPVEYTPSAAAGCLLPHWWRSDGTSVYDALGPDFTVVVLDPSVVLPPVDTPVPVRTVALEGADAETARNRWGAVSCVLVRPDQHVAYRGGVEGLAGALRTAVRGAADSGPRPAGRGDRTGHATC